LLPHRAKSQVHLRFGEAQGTRVRHAAAILLLTTAMAIATGSVVAALLFAASSEAALVDLRAGDLLDLGFMSLWASIAGAGPWGMLGGAFAAAAFHRHRDVVKARSWVGRGAIAGAVLGACAGAIDAMALGGLENSIAMLGYTGMAALAGVASGAVVGGWCARHAVPRPA
jgi:hypothetical protein